MKTETSQKLFVNFTYIKFNRNLFAVLVLFHEYGRMERLQQTFTAGIRLKIELIFIITS